MDANLIQSGGLRPLAPIGPRQVNGGCFMHMPRHPAYALMFAGLTMACSTGSKRMLDVHVPFVPEPAAAIPEPSHGRLAFQHGSDRIDAGTAEWLPARLAPCARGPVDVELRVEAVASAELIQRRRAAVQRSLAIRGVPAEHVRFLPLALRIPEPPGALLTFPPGCL